MPTNFHVSIVLYCASAQLSEGEFGELAANDWHLVSDIRRGRKLRPALYERVSAFMSANPST